MTGIRTNCRIIPDHFSSSINNKKHWNVRYETKNIRNKQVTIARRNEMDNAIYISIVWGHNVL